MQLLRSTLIQTCYYRNVITAYCLQSCARQNNVNAHVIMPGAHRSARHMRRTFDTCFTLSLIYHMYVLFVWISYQARFGLKISYPAIVFTMVIGLLNCGSFIVRILLLGTSKVFTLSIVLPWACVHVLLSGTRRTVHSMSIAQLRIHFKCLSFIKGGWRMIASLVPQCKTEGYVKYKTSIKQDKRDRSWGNIENNRHW